MKISIITICYNNKKGLEKTIKSVSAQTYKDKEFIIVDGGSNDGTTELYKKYINNINIFISKPDDGIYDAMNKGIKKASGEWVIMMNAGDTFAQNKVLEQVFNLDIPENIDFLYSDYYDKKKNGKLILNHVNRERGIVFHQAAIYKKKLHEQYGYYLQTHPYIVSDLLFFLSVPSNKFHKISIHICISNDEGISRNGTWVAEEALGMRIGFGIEHLSIAFLKLLKVKIMILIKRIF